MISPESHDDNPEHVRRAAALNLLLWCAIVILIGWLDS